MSGLPRPGLRGALAALLLLALAAAPARAQDGQARLDAAGLRRTVAEASASGAVAVVNFWATWCGPCREEIPHLRTLRREFPESSLALLGVSLDLDEAAYRSFVRAHPPGYATAFGGEQLMEELGVRALPRTEIYGPDGTLHRVFDGKLDASTLRREIKALLGRDKGGTP